MVLCPDGIRKTRVRFSTGPLNMSIENKLNDFASENNIEQTNLLEIVATFASGYLLARTCGDNFSIATHGIFALPAMIVSSDLAFRLANHRLDSSRYLAPTASFMFGLAAEMGIRYLFK